MGPALATTVESSEEKEHFVLGQYVEDLVFNTDTSRYVVFDFPAQNTNLGKAVASIFDHYQRYKVWPTEDEFEVIYTRLDIKRPNKDELWTQSWGILFELKDAINVAGSDVLVVSSDNHRMAKSAAEKIQNDSITSKMLINTDETQSLLKVPIFWDFGDTPCKGEIDLLRVDHTRRLVRIVDIKTLSGFVYFFETNFWKFRYDFQLSYYHYGLQQSNFFKENFKGYTLLNPMIIAVDFITEVPILYQLSDATLNIGENGGSTPSGREVKGWREAIDDYLFYEKNGYRYPKSVALNKFIEI